MGNGDLPVASGRQHAAAFTRLGWIEQTGRRRNSHIIMARDGHPLHLAIPNHDEVKRALLGKLLKAAGLSIDEYLDAFHRGRRKGRSRRGGASR